MWGGVWWFSMLLHMTLDHFGGLTTGGWLSPSQRTKPATEGAIEQQKGRLQDASNTHTQQPEGPYPAHAIKHHNNRKPEIGDVLQFCMKVAEKGRKYEWMPFW